MSLSNCNWICRLYRFLFNDNNNQLEIETSKTNKQIDMAVEKTPNYTFGIYSKFFCSTRSEVWHSKKLFGKNKNDCNISKNNNGNNNNNIAAMVVITTKSCTPLTSHHVISNENMNCNLIALKIKKQKKKKTTMTQKMIHLQQHQYHNILIMLQQKLFMLLMLKRKKDKKETQQILQVLMVYF